MHRLDVSSQQHANGTPDLGVQIKPRGKRSRSMMWALATSLSLFGFQLTGALADSVGMESPHQLSLVLRCGTSLIFVVLLLQTGLRIREDISGVALATGTMFLVLYGINLIITTAYPEYPLSRPPLEYGGYFLTFALIPFLGSASACSEKSMFFARNALISVTGIIVVVYWLSYSPSAFIGERFRPYESVNPIGIGYAGLVAATLAAWILYQGRMRYGFGFRCVMYFVMTSGAAMSLMVGQRQVLLSGVVTVFFIVFVSGGTGVGQGIMRRVLLGFLFGGIVCAVIYAGLADRTLIRLDNTAAEIQGGEEGRLEHWAEAVLVFKNNPIIGGPVELPVLRTWPHNLLLESFMVTGVPGGLLFMMFLLSVSVVALRLIYSSVLGWVGLIYYQMIVSAMLSGALYANVWYWVSAGLTLSAYGVARKSLKS